MALKRQWRGMKWLVWGIAVLYYFFEYVLRISPSVMINDIMEGFSISAMQAGNLSAVYFYIYALMQVPVGLLLDRYGVKLPLLCASLLCALGSLVFAKAHFLGGALMGRALIGLGSSFGYLSCLKIVANWFEVKRFGLMCGLVNMVGMLGAFFGEQLLSVSLTFMDWRTVMFYLAFVGMACAFLIILILKNNPNNGKPHVRTTGKHKGINLFKTLQQVVMSQQVWLCALYGGVVYGTFDMIGGLWGVPYLQHVYQLSAVEAAEINSLIFLGAIVGYVLYGYLTTHFKRKHKTIMLFTIILMTLDSLCILSNPSSLIIVKSLFFTLGLFCGVTATATTLAKENMPISMSGITMSLVNVFPVAIGSLSQPLFGYILDFSVHSDEHSLVNLSASDFNHAFMLLPGLYLIGLLACTFIKQTRGQKRD